LRIAGLEKLDRQFFDIRHLAKIGEIGAQDRNPVGTRQVGNATATSRRRIGHYGDRRALEQVWQLVLMHIAGELDPRIPRAFFLHRFHISRRLRMVAAGNHQFGCWQRFSEALEGLNHEFQPLIRSPLAECQNAMFGISAA